MFTKVEIVENVLTNQAKFCDMAAFKYISYECVSPMSKAFKFQFLT